MDITCGARDEPFGPTTNLEVPVVIPQRVCYDLLTPITTSGSVGRSLLVIPIILKFSSELPLCATTLVWSPAPWHDRPGRINHNRSAYLANRC